MRRTRHWDIDQLADTMRAVLEGGECIVPAARTETPANRDLVVTVQLS